MTLIREQTRGGAKDGDPDTAVESESDATSAPHFRARNADARAPPELRSLQGLATLPARASERVISVDALRGFSMFWILGADGAARAMAYMLVEKGSIFGVVGSLLGGQFEHSPWEGVTFYDLIFPLFIFITGVTIVFSLPRLVESEGKTKAHARVLKRSVLLFALGIIYYGGMGQSFADMRVLGVLNRIALCYLFASLLFLNLRPPALLAAVVAILVGYWALLTFVPVPGVGPASYEQGVNLADWIDEHYLPGRKWNGRWDPEGILSTLPAIATCLIGVFAGLWLKAKGVAPPQKSAGLLGAGLAMVALGWLWGLQFPVIKNIWTSSYVLLSGGFSACLLAIFHHTIDVRGHKTWSMIFVWIGVSAITLYVVHGVVGFDVLAARVVGGDIAQLADTIIAPGAGDFFKYVAGMALAIALAGFLYRRKIFLRV